MLSPGVENFRPALSRQRPFAEFSYSMLGTLEFDERLRKAAEFGVREFCDWCAVDVVDGPRFFRRQLVLHRDPELQDVAARLLAEFPPLFPLQVGESLFNPEEDLELTQRLRTDAAFPLYQRLGCRSFLVMPLAARGHVFANITFASATVSFGPTEADFAHEIAGLLAVSADNARLYQEAQKAIRIRDEVMGVVAHDLKNPLSAIRLSLQVFERKFNLEKEEMIPAAPVGKLVHAVDRSVSRATRLITDLLDFSKATSGKMSIQPEPVCVDLLLNEAAEFLRPLALERSLEIEVEHQLGSLKVLCESERIHQVFSNLIGNAIKFTPPGGRIRIGAVLQGEEVVFSVADNGPGIPENDIEHLFERYWQATRTKELGAGLGLPICKGIIDAHQGRIWAESVFGEGTRFFFTLTPSPRKELS